MDEANRLVRKRAKKSREMVRVASQFKHLTEIISDELVEEQSSQVVFPRDPVKFTRYTRVLDGKKFSFKDRSYLLDIYRDCAKEVYIAKGRQTEITEFAINWLLHRLVTNPETVGLYLTDRDSHVRIFSEDRLKNKALRTSTSLQQAASLDSHTLHKQVFENGSVLYMFSGWGKFEQARSIAADFVVIDEAQEVNISEIDVVREAMSHSKFGQMRVIGTGSDEGSSWEKLYSSGKCLEWDILKQKWIAKNPQARNNSYHIPQSITPGVTPDMIELKRATAKSPRRFTTEVLGWWYRGMRKPLLAQDIQALMDRNIDFTGAADVNHDLGPVYIGVDWGGGTQAFTVAWVWQLIHSDVPRFKLLYVKKYDAEEDRSTEVQARKVSRLIDVYEADRVVMDAGGGPYQVEILSKRYAERVYRCNYMARPEFPFEPISSEHRINVDRTWIIETIIDLITRPETRSDFTHPIPRIIIPGVAERMEEVEWIVDNFTCIEAETTEAMGKSRAVYTHPDDTMDDCMHACCYAYLAYLLDVKTKVSWVRF